MTSGTTPKGYRPGRRPGRTRNQELSGKLNCNATPSSRSNKTKNPQSESLKKDITASEFIRPRFSALVSVYADARTDCSFPVATLYSPNIR
jgi:hypothetical protein